MLHINGLELLAAFYAIKSFVGQELGLFIHIVLNNTTHYNTTYNNIHITTWTNVDEQNNRICVIL